MSEEDFGEEELSLKLKDRTISKLFKMTILYRQLLSEKGFDRVDFSSLQQRAYKYICQKKGAGSVFKHVIVDEYQDTNTIQQKIYLKLAEGTKNICVVGDDDQALYRFRGATVENLVDFENICKKEIGVRPKRIDLNINYRSRKQIVDTYTQFIDLVSWRNPSKPSEFFRIQNKDIQANSKDVNTSVVLETGDKQTVTENIASLIKKLKRTGKIKDYNQCAILFPTIRGNASGEMSPKVQAFADALEEAGIKYYAPRAKNFLYTEESLITFGLFAKIFGYSPSGITYGGMADFSNWAEMAIDSADEIIEQDKSLAKFIDDTQQSIKASKQNHKYLSDYCERNGISLDDDLTIPLLKKLSQTPRIDDSVRRTLVNKGILAFTARRANEGKPLHVSLI